MLILMKIIDCGSDMKRDILTEIADCGEDVGMMEPMILAEESRPSRGNLWTWPSNWLGALLAFAEVSQRES
jgi:hypothetical protein